MNEKSLIDVKTVGIFKYRPCNNQKFLLHFNILCSVYITIMKLISFLAPRSHPSNVKRVELRRSEQTELIVMVC